VELKGTKALKDRDNQAVKTMAREIITICTEAVEYQYEFNQFKELLLNQIKYKAKL